MEIDITRLQNNIDEYIEINESFSFDKNELEKTELIDLKKGKIDGYLSKNSNDEYIIDIEVSGIFIIPCSISLKPVEYPFETKIEGNIFEMLAEMAKNYKKTEKTIDIFPIIWENVLMEIPIKVVSDDLNEIKTKGDGWELLSSGKENINPELAKLKDMLKERGV